MTEIKMNLVVILEENICMEEYYKILKCIEMIKGVKNCFVHVS